MVGIVIKKETSKIYLPKENVLYTVFFIQCHPCAKKNSMYFISTVKDDGIVSYCVSKGDCKFVDIRIK